jgi:predicted tellurium resistance membrane protein TerC
MPLPRGALKVLLICLVISDTFAFVHTHRAVSRCTYNPRRYVDGGLSRSPRPALWSKISDADFDTSSTPLVSTDLNEEDKENGTYAIAFRNTILSIAVAILFGAGLWFTAGPITAEEYFAGYIVEKSLSVDNLFVFLLLFDYFQVPRQYQSRVLTWGIYGSVIMRTIMIGLGATALQNFHGILLVFASILIYSAIQVLVDVEEEIMEQENDLSGNPIVKFSTFLCESSETCNIDDFEDKDLTNPVIVLSRSLLPSTNKFDGDRFFTMEDGIKKATPLFVCMIAVELSDVVFAVDSIPAVFGVTENTLVVFSSNMFAILGLRSLYPVLSKAATDLKYLEPAVALILAFIGAKMIAEYFGYTIPTEEALAVIISLLSVGVGASVLDKMKNERDGTNDLT